jgi:hypothetical protein
MLTTTELEAMSSISSPERSQMMEDIMDEFWRLPILLKTNKSIVVRFREKVTRLITFGLAGPFTNTLESFLNQVTVPGSIEAVAHQEAIEDLMSSLQLNPRYLQLKIEWVDEIYNDLVLNLADVIHGDDLAKLLDIDTLKENSRSGEMKELTPDQLSAVKNTMLSLNRKLRALPNSPGFLDQVVKEINDMFQSMPLIRKWVSMIYYEDQIKFPQKWCVQELPEPLRRSLTFGFRNYLTAEERQNDRKIYLQWLCKCCDWIHLVDPDLLQEFLCIFQFPESDIGTSSDIGGLESAINSLALIEVLVRLAGAEDWLVDDCKLALCPAVLNATNPPNDPIDLSIRKWLWKTFDAGLATNFTWPEYLAKGAQFMKDFSEKHLAPLAFFGALSNIISTIGIGLYNLLDKLLEVTLGALIQLANREFDALQEYCYLTRAFASYLLPEARRRPKAVWALLFNSSFTKMSPAERFLAGCKTMQEPSRNLDYKTWAEARLRAFKDIVPTEPLPYKQPIRPMFLPRAPTVADVDKACLAPLIPKEVYVDEGVSKWIGTLLKQGVDPGISGIWFGTDERRVKSITRYDIDRPAPDDIVKNIVVETAHALAGQFPEMYEDSKYLTPEMALRKVKQKYSATLPLLTLYRDKKEMNKVGLFAASARVAQKILEEGVHPGTVAHCFVKDDVISLDKLLKGKNIRTVIAQEIVGNVVAYCSTLETTRRQPPPEAFVMNAVPRSEGGFRPFYDRLRKHINVIQADAKEFDSKLAPVITVDGLTELRGIGYKHSPIYRQALAQIRAVYVTLSYAMLVDLGTGFQYNKTGGMMTGGANTAIDNRDAFRLMWIAAWSLVADRPPSTFWQTNTLGNAGDDDAIGSDDPPEWIPLIIDKIKDAFGVEVVIEVEGFENLSLVGLIPMDVPRTSVQMYQVRGQRVPEYSIASDRLKLLSKRTEFKTSVSRWHGVPFLMKHVEGLIGSTMLTAHHLEVYQDFAEEYVREMTEILIRFFKHVTIQKGHNDFGEMVSVLVIPTQPRDRYVGKVSELLKWLKSHRFPTYDKVFDSWIKPQEYQVTKMARDHRKILSWVPRYTFFDNINLGLISTRQALNSWIPLHVAKSLPEFPGQDITAVLRNQDYIIAKFVWLSLYHARSKRVPPSGLFLTALRENPYGSAEDPFGFLNWLTSNDNLDILASEDLELHRCRILLLTLVYWKVETFFLVFSQVPTFGILINLYSLTTRDINRLYAALNYIYMIATGRSSPIISNMMPPDPYAWIKQFSVIVTGLVPLRWCVIPGVKHVSSVLPWATELWAGVNTAISPPLLRTLYNLIDVPDLWSDLVQSGSVHFTTPGSTILVVAPTGTGKSTAFIAALTRILFLPGKIWLLCPTVVTRNEYSNPFLPSDHVEKLDKGLISSVDKRIKILTYGHFVQSRRSELLPGDLVIMDEPHLVEPMMIAAYHLAKAHVRIGITATPRPTIMPIFDVRLDYRGEKRFNTNVVYSNSDFRSLWSDIRSKHPAYLKRALVVAPTRKKVLEIIATLARESILAFELSSFFPDAHPTGVIVATPIVDTGVTILPHPTCLIDFGEELDVSYDYTELWPKPVITVRSTSASTHKQRVGRVGRGSDSIAFILGKGGLGPESEPKPSAFELINSSEFQTVLLASYGVGLTLIKRAGAARGDISDFIHITEQYIGPAMDGNTLSLAFYIFMRLSCNMDVESVKQEWYDLKVEKSQYELINLIVENSNELGSGECLLGNFTNSCDLLAAGLFFVETLQGNIACTCVGITNNLVVPCGPFTGYLSSIDRSVSINPVFISTNSRVWPSLNKFKQTLRFLNRQIVDYTIRSSIDRNFQNLTPDLLLDREAFYPYSPSFVNMMELISPKASRLPKDQLIVEVAYDNDPFRSINPYRHSYAITFRVGGAPFGSVDLYSIKIGADINPIVLTCILAAFYPDNCGVVWIRGNVGPPPLVIDNPVGGLIIHSDCQWMMIQAGYARSQLNKIWASKNLTTGLGPLHYVPKSVFIDPIPVMAFDMPMTKVQMLDNKLVLVL